MSDTSDLSVAKLRVPPSVNLARPESLVFERDHIFVVSMAASFKDSIRRDVMIGRNVACAL